MKIAVCSIMCNSEFLLNEWMEHYYNLADYICISEGVTKNWGEKLNYTSPNSTDNTNKILNSWIEKDYLNKIRIVHGDKFYNEKLEQSNAFMSLVPSDTNYIWYVDDDEFYMQEDFIKMRRILQETNYSYAEFKQLSFFKSFDIIARGGSSWAYEAPIPRLFKYHKGAMFTSHRPPTILNENGIDVKDILPLMCDKTEEMGIYFRHYSYINTKRVYEKLKYYDATFPNAHGIMDYYSDVWFKDVFEKWTIENRKEIEKTLSVHPTGYGAYTEMFTLQHPEVIKKMLIKRNL